MKKIILALFFATFLVQFTIGQCSSLKGTYTEGSTFSYATFNAKNELISTTNYKVEEIRNEPDRILILIKYIQLNKKGKETDKGNRNIIVSGTNYNINVSALVPGYKSDDPTYIQYHCAPKMNEDILEFSKVTTYKEDNMGQISIISSKIGLEDGKYGERETITTDAGTFDCIKLSYKIRFDLQKYLYTEWIDDATGRIIKVERKDEKGALDSTSFLMSYSK